MRLPSPVVLGAVVCLVSACAPSVVTPPAPDAGTLPVNLAPELGPPSATAADVTLTVIADRSNGLRTPRDLAFNPLRPDELWVVNRGDDSVVIVTDASTEGRTTERRKDGYALHFMEESAALAFGGDETTFGKPGTFATCGESRNTYDDRGEPNDFMGPALWSSALDVFAQSNPNGLGSHLDMLHNTPLCMGIAHETANVYWAFGGLTGALYRYDFKEDNGIGNDDHGDGEVREFVKGELAMQPDVPSHLQYRAADAMVYVADSGNARVAKLDATSGTKGRALTRMEDMGPANEWTGATLVDVVSKESGLVTVPSGLELNKDRLFVSDNSNGRISAFDLNGGLLNYVETGLPEGALAGMAFGPDGKLYFVDMLGNRVLRLDP